MQKFSSICIAFLLLFLFNLQPTYSGYVSPVWVAKSIFKAGAVSFTFTSGAVLQNATITYSSAIINSNLKVPTLGITDLNFAISAGKIYLLILVVQYTPTLMKFQVQIATSSSLSLLKMTYMAIDNSFGPPFSMNYFFPNINQNTTGVTAQFYVNFTSSTGVTLNTSHQNVLLPFMHYISLITYDNTIDINLNFTVLNSSFYTVIITSASKINLQYAGFSRLIFDKTAIEALGNDYFNYGVISSTNNNNAAFSTTIPPNIIPSNLYYGLHSFTITTALSSLYFTSSYVVSSGFIGYSSQGTFIYSKMSFSYMHHKTRTCPSDHPYYYIALVLCYDICPARWYGDTSTSTCLACLYDCYTCTNGTACATCNATTDFRTLSSSRCVPLNGYYDTNTNNSVASMCSSPCVTCQTTPTTCLTCISGYYVSNNACLECGLALTNCLACNSSTYCTQCADGSSGSSCSQCTYGQFLQNSTDSCVDCSSVITYCRTCVNETTCTLCIDTFTLFGPTNCSCLFTQYQYQTEGALNCFSCADSMPYCYSCSNSYTCDSCYPTFNLIAGSCSCNASSFVNNSGMCQLCSSAINYCTACTSSTACTSCLATFTIISGTCQCSSGYYFDSNSTSCLSCGSAISQCATCINSTWCLTCNSGYQINSTTQMCDLILCVINNCYECITGNYNVCQYCDSGYSLSSAHTSCRVVCGDYQLYIATQQCDDGNTVSGDGCSSTCQIQYGFSCSPQYVNITQTYSICFYSGTISFNLLWTRKIQGSNQLKFLFQLNQQINQWNIVNFTQITQVDFVDSSTNFTLGMTSVFIQSSTVVYDPINNRFSLTIGYFNYSLQKQLISVALSPYFMGYPVFTPPPNVEFFPPTISSIFTVLADNNQNSNVYSDSQYGLYNASVIIAYIILGLALLTALTSLVFRKGSVITFEMLTIIQVCYFSLTFLDSMNPFFAGLLPLRYLTGILNFQFVENYLYEYSSLNAMKGIYIYLKLSSNFNIVAFILGIFLLLGFVLLIIYFLVSYFSKSTQTDQTKETRPKGYWMQRIAYHFIGELAISMVLTWLPLYTISLLFQIMYTRNSPNFWSYAEAVGVGIAIVAYFVALIKTPHLKQGEFSRLGEYISQFRQVSLFEAFKYPNLQMLQTFIIGGLIMVCINSKTKLFCTMFIIFICFVDIVLVAIVKPYKYGFVSCFRTQDQTEQLFQKIELYKVYDKEQPSIKADLADASRKGELEQNASEVFTQHFATRKNILKTRHQGLIQAGQILSQSKLFLFNNNFRRIINLTTLILVQFVFLSAKLFEAQINQSSDSINIKMLLPFFIYIILFLNMLYNYMFLVLQILDRTRENMNLHRVEDNPDSSSQFMKSIYTTNVIKKEAVPDPDQSEVAPNIPMKSHKQILQENTMSKSLYNLKRPQILHPTRKGAIRRTNKKLEDQKPQE